MAAIQISELRLAGYDLLQDSQSFLDELASQEIQNIAGGHSYKGGHHNHSHSHKSHDYSHDYSHGYSKGYSKGWW